MALVLAWLRVELRRRWRALLVLALLVALAAGTVLTAVAGARRGVTAVDRLLEVTRPATVVVSPQDETFDWTPIRQLPEVEAVGTYVVYSGFGVDEAVTGGGDGAPTVAIPIPYDAETMRSVERPVVLDGRLADPQSADEAVVTPAFVSTYGRGVGDTVTVRLFSVEQVENGASAVRTLTPPPLDGPALPVRIVGVVRSLWLADCSDGTAGPGRLFPSPGLIAAHRANFVESTGSGALNGLVRLRDGDAGIPAFRADLARIAAARGLPPFDVVARDGAAQRVRDVARFQAAFLLAFGVAALAASLVLVGLAVTRYGTAAAGDLAVLGAIGMTRRHRVVCAVAGPAVAAVAGAVLGVAGAVVASAWMPFGTAAGVEPTPGVDVDALVLGAGGLATVVLVTAAAAVAALRGTATRRSRPRPSAAARLAGVTGLPVPLVVGIRFALEPDRGPGATAVRPALVGAVTGVLGVMAALTLAAGVADAAAHPERFGQTYQLNIGTGYSFNGQVVASPATVGAIVASDPDVVSLADTPFAVADTAGATVLVFSTPPAVGTGAPPLTLTGGRLPTAPGEAVLAPSTAARLGARIGSAIPLSFQTTSMTVRVVGTALLPQTPYNDYDAGAWIGPADYATLFGGFFVNRPGLAGLRPGADPAVVSARIESAVAAATGIRDFLFPDVAPVPRRLGEVASLRTLTLALGGFLALVATGAVGHALVTSVRRRRRDIAVLRALGMTPGQARGVVVTQASVLAAVGLVLGVPLGVALGRVLWGVVADVTPLAYRAPVAATALLLVVPVAQLLANALAAWPGRRAARLGLASTLRAE